jgi:D-glycerate 3-kinase
MNVKIENNIQIQLFELTKKKFSKKYIDTKIIPIIKYIVNSNKKKFLISGSQGIGKSTLIKILKDNIEKYFDKKIMTLNLDDYYLSKDKRIKLSKTKHNLFKTRGVPGTHDIKKLKKNINDFEKSIYPISIPVFDKLIDDRSSKIRKEKEKKDILILEGWCCGCPPLEKKFLDKNINELERLEDKDRIWRNYFNRNLDNEYKKIFKIFDKIIFMEPPSFKFVFNWRSKQEKMNNSNYKNYKRMSKKELLYFISHYEKITKWMIKKLPNTADLVININNKQEIIKNKFINID